MVTTLNSLSRVRNRDLLYHVYFLRKSEDLEVELREVEKLDFLEIMDCLMQRDSVFITCKDKLGSDSSSKYDEVAWQAWAKASKTDAIKPWYFKHV